MEISKSTGPQFYISRILGYAPYVIERDYNGKIGKIKSSKLLCSYSLILIVSLGKWYF